MPKEREREREAREREREEREREREERERERERERMREGWHTRRTLASALRISTSNHAIKKETTQCREDASCSGQKRTPCCKAK